MNVNTALHELPALPDPQPGDAPVYLWHTYAEVTAGEIVSEVRRSVYWDEQDGQPLEVSYEVRINGLPETAGFADITADRPDVLTALSAVSAKAAELLAQLQAGAA